MRYDSALLTCTLVVACGPDTHSGLAPSHDIALELTEPLTRVPADWVSAHVYGSFRVDGGGSTPAVITSGPANFPGAPKAGPGTCVNGLWYNSQAKATSGSLTKPHPHCIKPSAAIEVVLEPISVCFTGWVGCPLTLEQPAGGHRSVILFGDGLRLEGVSSTSEVVTDYAADRVLEGYAVDAATLGTTNKRVGTLKINLPDYRSIGTNYLDFSGPTACALDATLTTPCLNKVITARYNPLPAPHGLGPTDFSVSGFLWLAPASSPYNYLDDPNYLMYVVCPQQWTERFGSTPMYGGVGTPFDAQVYCTEVLPAADNTECQKRLFVLTGLTGPGTGPNPCISDAPPFVNG